MKIDDHGIFMDFRIHFSHNFPIIFRQSHGVPWKWDEVLERFAKSWRIRKSIEPLNEFLFPVKPSFLVHSTGVVGEASGTGK